MKNILYQFKSVSFFFIEKSTIILLIQTFIKMKVKIWMVLAQILFYRNDLIEIIKPFFENLKNENINDEKSIVINSIFKKII